MRRLERDRQGDKPGAVWQQFPVFLPV